MEEHLKKMLNEIKDGKAKLFDVRELDEWEDGHLKIAELAPLSKLNEGEIPKPVQDCKDKTIYLHCRSGNRVLVAEEILNDEGFENVIPLEEGFADLVEEGLEEAE